MNWAEVLYKMERKSGAQGLTGARDFERTLPLDVVPLDRELAESAAHLKNEHDLGLADAFAAALAKSKSDLFHSGEHSATAPFQSAAIRGAWIGLATIVRVQTR